MGLGLNGPAIKRRTFFLRLPYAKKRNFMVLCFNLRTIFQTFIFLQVSGEKVLLVPYQRKHVQKYHQWMKSQELQVYRIIYDFLMDHPLSFIEVVFCISCHHLGFMSQQIKDSRSFRW